MRTEKDSETEGETEGLLREKKESELYKKIWQDQANKIITHIFSLVLCM